MKKWEKNHNFWAFLRGGTGTKHSGTGTEFLVPVPNVLFWTIVRILAINWSFIILFE